jgi:hypothetical protein
MYNFLCIYSQFFFITNECTSIEHLKNNNTIEIITKHYSRENTFGLKNIGGKTPFIESCSSMGKPSFCLVHA